MYISYDYYRIFYYVAKNGSFTRAAEALFANQPNLTRAVKALESELGCKLFVRSNKGVDLTPEGEKLYAHISLAIEHIQAGEEEIAMNKSLNKGVVSIGATEISLRCFLLPILNEFREKYPNVRLKISNISTPNAISLVQNGLVDFSVVTTPFDKNSSMKVRTVKKISDVLVSGKVYKEKLGNEEVSLSKLAGLPFISPSEGSGTYLFYEELFERYGAAFSPDIEADTVDRIMLMVKHDLGIGFVPSDILKDDGDGAFRIFLKESIPQRDICLITGKDNIMSLPAKELERMIIEKQETF